MSARRSKITWLIVFAVSLVVGAAWAWQSQRTRIESVVIDGHRIEFLRHGSGRPAIIFLHGGFGGGPGLESWRPWLTRVSTTTFCYSRPGSGNSEPAKDDRTPTRIVEELHLLLHTVGIQSPYVLVGGSLGALHARAFAMKFPGEVAGLVLVDGTHERQWLELNKVDARNPVLPPPDPGPVKADYTGMIATIVAGRLDLPGQLPDVPLAVITSLHHGKGPETAPKEHEESWRKLQGEIFQSTTYGMHVVTTKSGHGIARDEPALVLNAIRWVLDAARANQKSPAQTAPH